MVQTITKNFVINGGGEADTGASDFSTTVAPSNWAVTGGMTVVRYAIGGSGDLNADDSAAVDGGFNYFAGGPNSAVSTATQYISLTSYLDELAAGPVGFVLSGDFGGFQSQGDQMTLTLRFLDLGTDEISRQTLTVTAADRGNLSDLLYRELTGAVPANTGYVTVTLEADRTDGSYNDAYADNISFRLTGADLPGAALLVKQTHNYSTDHIGAQSGIEFMANKVAVATLASDQFGSDGIAAEGTIVGDAQKNTVSVLVGDDHAFDAGALAFGNWIEGIDVFKITGSTAGDSIIGSGIGDTILGGGGKDTIDLSGGGNDIVNGGAGNDTIVMGAALTTDDRIDGGAGNNTVVVDGVYASIVLFGSTLANVQTLVFSGNHSYEILMADGNLAAGAVLKVDAAGLVAGQSLIFHGDAETDGRFNITGTGGDDSLTGGQAGNSFIAGGGADHMQAQTGNDTFFYNGANDSTNKKFDTIIGFDAAHDKINVSATGADIASVDPTVTGGPLRAGHFVDDLTAAVGAQQLKAHHAVLFDPGSGNYGSDVFLVVDLNGKAGFQAGKDLVIDLSGGNLIGFDAHNIIG